MGRPEGPWYRETQASPHHGHHPQNAIASNRKTRFLGPRKGLFRHSAHPISRNKAGQRDRQAMTYNIPYNIASKMRKHTDASPTPKHARVVSSGPRVEGVGHRPPKPPRKGSRAERTKIAQSQSLAISALTEPDRQKSRRKKGFWGPKSQIASDFPSHP